MVVNVLLILGVRRSRGVKAEQYQTFPQLEYVLFIYAGTLVLHWLNTGQEAHLPGSSTMAECPKVKSRCARPDRRLIKLVLKLSYIVGWIYLSACELEE
jgi:hypothetical protein